MSELLSIIAVIITVILGIPALVLAIISYLGNKRISREFDSSLGTPAVEIRWGSPTQSNSLPCRVTAKFNRAKSVRLKVKNKEISIDALAKEEWKDFEFANFPEGTRFKLAFIDPVENRKYKREGVIRYEQVDF